MSTFFVLFCPRLPSRIWHSLTLELTSIYPDPIDLPLLLLSVSELFCSGGNKLKRRLTRRDRVWRLLLRPVAVDRGHKPLSKREREGLQWVTPPTPQQPPTMEGEADKQQQQQQEFQHNRIQLRRRRRRRSVSRSRGFCPVLLPPYRVLQLDLRRLACWYLGLCSAA